MTVAGGDEDALGAENGAAEREFAEAVIRLYQDPALCEQMSRACGSYIRRYYSLDAAWSVIEEDFTTERKTE